MKRLLSIFLGLILLILASHLKINVMYLTKPKKSFKIHFNINLGLYLFGMIKIFGISLKEDGIHLLCFTFPYPSIKIDKHSMKILKNFSIIDKLRPLNIKLEKLYLDLKIGTENIMLTVFLVVAISSFLSITSGKNQKQINVKKYHYQITPIYQTNQLSFQLSSQISIPIRNLIKTIIFAPKSTPKKNQKLESFSH